MSKTILFFVFFICYSLNAQTLKTADLIPDDKSTIIPSGPGYAINDVLLNRHDYWISYFKKTEKGELNFISFFTGREEVETLVVQKEYVHYTIFDKKKIGVLIRLQAEVEIMEAKIEINNLQGMAAAAELGIAKGDIFVKIWGLAGAPLFEFNLKSDFNSVSLAELENKINELHSKVASDSAISIEPVILPDTIFELRDKSRVAVKTDN